MRSWPLAALLVLTALPAPAQAHAGDDHAVTVDPAAALFPTADEVASAIDAVADDPWVTVHTLGTSLGGRPIRLLEVTDPASTVPREQRVHTLIETQQHGNEPAGTGAAVPLIQDLGDASSPLRALLGNQVLLLLPMSNPDGATANTRGNQDGTDVNRDHIGLETPEARAIKSVLTRWDVHVAIDHHEYSGTGLGNPVPVRIYDFDLTTMRPNHGNVRQPTADAALALDQAVWAAAQDAGYSAGEYGWTTVNGIKVEQTAGGPDPGILRNAFGLANVAGLLAETFVSAQPEDVAGVENPFQSAQRRIAIHRNAMEATLRFAHDNAGDLIAAKRESERLNRDAPLADYWEPAAGTTSPEVRSPLAAAYRVTDDLGQLLALHGIGPGVATGEGFVHNVHGEAQAGILAAIVHPDSSRGLVDGVPTQAIVVPATLQGQDGEDASLAVAPLLLLALLGLALRRRG